MNANRDRDTCQIEDLQPSSSSFKGMYGRYREFFDESIQGLFDDGWLGPDRKEVTEKFFELLMVQSGGIFEATKFSKKCEVSRTTITNYLKVLIFIFNI